MVTVRGAMLGQWTATELFSGAWLLLDALKQQLRYVCLFTAGSPPWASNENMLRVPNVHVQRAEEVRQCWQSVTSVPELTLCNASMPCARARFSNPDYP